MTESGLYEQLARYLSLKHTGLIWHFDLSGVNNPSKYTRGLYGRLNKRAWPDLFIAQPVEYKTADGKHLYFPGLFIEIKRERTRLKKRDGSWASEHIAEQAAVLDALAQCGYVAVFAVGFDECVETIESYLAGRHIVTEHTR